MEKAPFTASDLWAQAFVKRLMDLQPGLDLSQAIVACEEAFVHASQLAPEDAADYVAGAAPRP